MWLRSLATLLSLSLFGLLVTKTRASEELPAGSQGEARLARRSLGSNPSIVQRRGTFTPRWPYGGWHQGNPIIRGVSLGGWLVVESYITPSLYDATGPADNGVHDEWTFGSLVERSKATALLQRHLDTFITETDLQDIARRGFTHVRIPIGYWAFDVSAGEPFLKLNQWELLQRAACQWAPKYNLKVHVDLHGAPGSQNGWEHSGRRGEALWGSNSTTVERTLAIIETMATAFATDECAAAVDAIEVLNEPYGVDEATLHDFYRRAYDVVRSKRSDKGDLVFLFSDSFVEPTAGEKWDRKWGDFMRPPQYQGVAEDIHAYSIFDLRLLGLDDDARAQHYCNFKRALPRTNAVHWSVVGEFSPVFTDCAKYLLGRDRGHKYDGTQPNEAVLQPPRSCQGLTGRALDFDEEFVRRLRRFYEVQAEAYGQGTGWFLWTWKTEEGVNEEWSASKGLERGWIKLEGPAIFNC